ncbi:MAG: hypothetical protein BECKG1743D_GA0114223_106823 [Candidatus Kentron sp. G]|nr:MAG: hypothetical protein BECKG1743F_GA0114225_106653 [Candidatus Kentron sp. G]VFN03908.1 MAG: hypothetical protein BECKG1743E_GA0114224_106703 [Candidatus Kentron sp. G]VFN05183.1 MAG: hypothetical protein BECKG1743D_GA0114223_106823 [Candidatus Kentron sp. G]
MNKFPASIPRTMYWSKEVGGTTRCPECGGSLTSESHTYLMAFEEGGETANSLVGNSGGYFCEKCPTVVLDSKVFAESAVLRTGTKDPQKLTILGIVDLSAVPEGNESMPLGADGNPIPLVNFIDRRRRGGVIRRKASRARQKQARKNNRKRR